MRITTVAASLMLAVTCGCAQQPSREQTPALQTSTSEYESVALTLSVGNARAGRQAFLDLKCTTCHRVAGEADFPAPFSDHLGPDLEHGRQHRSPSDLATAIVAPSHAVSTNISPDLKARLEGVLSPMGDFSQAMTVRQLSDLVAYLRSLPVNP